MDREIWTVVLKQVKRAARQLSPAKRMRYPDWLITALFLWAVAHERPMCWACDRRNYTSHFRPPKRLPSVSQFTRRVKSPRVQTILQTVHEALAGPPLAFTALCFLDGKPLPIGAAGKDPDAKVGHVIGGFAKGYKLHAMVTEDRRIPMWCVRPLNEYEPHIAAVMLGQGVRFSPNSLLLADGNYDDHDFHKLVDRCGGRLLTAPRGQATHPVTLRQMGPARRELLAAWQTIPSVCRMVYKHRIGVEGTFSNVTACGGGLQSLPSFVRRLSRVTRWVGAKLILYHAHLQVQKQSAA